MLTKKCTSHYVKHFLIRYNRNSARNIFIYFFFFRKLHRRFVCEIQPNVKFHIIYHPLVKSIIIFKIKIHRRYANHNIIWKKNHEKCIFNCQHYSIIHTNTQYAICIFYKYGCGLNSLSFSNLEDWQLSICGCVSQWHVAKRSRIQRANSSRELDDKYTTSALNYINFNLTNWQFRITRDLHRYSNIYVPY